MKRLVDKFVNMVAEAQEKGEIMLGRWECSRLGMELLAVVFEADASDGRFLMGHKLVMTDEEGVSVRFVYETAPRLKPNWAGMFENYEDWRQRGSLSATMLHGAVCIDTKGRRCNVGKDFMRARDEGTFPVRYFWEMEAE